MNEDLLTEKFMRINDRLIGLEKKLFNAEGKYKLQIINLCKLLEDLTKTIKWFMGLIVASLLGFFFYAVQQGLFK